MTNSSGVVKARYDYLPFGEELGATIGQRTVGMGYSAADSTRRKFTQKERDSESGLDFFGARYHSSAQGRFTSVDPENAGANHADPQSWNGYVYVRNNPLLLVDPDGETYVIYGPMGGGTLPDEVFYSQKKYFQGLGFTFTGDGTFFESGDIISPDGKVVASYYQVSIDDNLQRFSFEMSRRSKASMQAIGAFAGVTYGTGAAIGASVFYGPAAVEFVRRTVPTLLRAAPKVDPNKLTHIFGKAQHNLGNLVRQFGSQERAFDAIQKATEAAVASKGLQGLFEEVVKVGTETITVTGKVVDGVVRIGTAYKP